MATPVPIVSVILAGDGVTKTFAFSFPYLHVSHITVLIDGVPVGGFTVIGQTVVFLVAPADLTVIEIRRTTSHDELYVRPQTQASMPPVDLRAALHQILYFTEEVAAATA